MRASLKKKLKNKSVCVGSWIQIGHPAVAEIMANQGFDWLCVDLEHGHIDIESLTNIFRTLQVYNIASLARLPKNDETWIRRALDAGADGLIIPLINTAEEARYAVKMAKYPPEGSRGFGYCRANTYGAKFNEYVEKINEEVLIIAQIEHFKAIENLPEILDVNGIDAVFIGPMDLSGSYGRIGQLDSPEMKTALEKYLSLCEQAGMPAGLHIIKPEPSSVIRALESGYTLIALGLDVTFLNEGANKAMNSIITEKIT
ncbi:MAG: aldolase/citrate lyase family protein [Cytophagales bacterium]|nr:aldolase/citrate lyase family protein [Cytophagales bacterium]